MPISEQKTKCLSQNICPPRYVEILQTNSIKTPSLYELLEDEVESGQEDEHAYVKSR